MAQLFTVVQRKGFSVKVYNRGIYTNKKKMWEVWFTTEILNNPIYKNVKLYDDVKNIYRDPTYSNLCNMLTANGRVCVFATDPKIAPLVEAVATVEPPASTSNMDDLETDKMIQDLAGIVEVAPPVPETPKVVEPVVETEVQIAMINAAEKNGLRKWDIDEEGNLVPNPVPKGADNEIEE